MRGTPELFAGVGSGGVNLHDAPYNLGAGEAADARNCKVTQRGKVRSRDGNVTFSTLAGEAQSLFAMQNPDFLIASYGTVIRSIDTAGVSTQIASGLTTGLPWDFIQSRPSDVGGAQGPIYGLNGVDTPLQWTGSGSMGSWTHNSGGAFPFTATAKYIEYANNRVWVVDKSSVFFSAIGDPREWPAENQINFDADDGEEITGISALGPYLIVAKSQKLWMITDLDNGDNQRIGENIGTVSNRSLVETPMGLMFLSLDQGICVTDGSTITPISERVMPALDLLIHANRARACAAYSDRHYVLSVSLNDPPLAADVNNFVIDFDFDIQGFLLHTCAAQEYAVWESGSTPGLYAAKADSAIVEQQFVPGELDDNDLAMTSYWVSPAHSNGMPYTHKRITQVHVDGGGDIDISFAKDFDRTLSLQEELDLDTTSYEVVDGYVLTPGTCRTLSIVASNDQVGEYFELDSYTIGWRVRTK